MTDYTALSAGVMWTILEGMTVRELARLLGLGRSQAHALLQTYREVFGPSPIDETALERIREARQMVHSGAVPSFRAGLLLLRDGKLPEPEVPPAVVPGRPTRPMGVLGLSQPETSPGRPGNCLLTHGFSNPWVRREQGGPHPPFHFRYRARTTSTYRLVDSGILPALTLSLPVS